MGQFRNIIKEKKAPCKALPAPFDVKLFEDKDDIVQPDICIVCDESKLENGQRCEGAPDLVVEIVSPSNPKHDYFTKLNLYMKAGVKEYWIVDPKTRAVHIYSAQEEDFTLETHTFSEEISSLLFPELNIKLA